MSFLPQSFERKKQIPMDEGMWNRLTSAKEALGTDFPPIKTQSSKTSTAILGTNHRVYQFSISKGIRESPIASVLCE